MENKTLYTLILLGLLVLIGGVFAATESFDNIQMNNYNITNATLIEADSFSGSLTGNANTATALAANGANCASGSYPLGVDASGAVESCTDATTEINSAISASGHLSNVVEDVTPQLGGNLDSQSKNITAISYAHFGTGCVYHNGSHIIVKGTC